MDKRINLIEFLINSIKMFKSIENILIYDKKKDKYYNINELYHINTDDNSEYMIIEFE